MRKSIRNLSIIIFLVVLVLPFFPVVVVPEWKVQLVDSEGHPAPNVKVDQIWKEYSLEFWRSGENVEHDFLSDADGFITFPERSIRVSVFQLAVSKLRSLALSINPHASFGSHAYLQCREKRICNVSYNDGVEIPQHVLVGD
ncbi:MAG: hypothetical protein KF855_10815 [Acidobacteria bacterium]|nr:hypothetical protein [Acidobacteriota bacterium]